MDSLMQYSTYSGRLGYYMRYLLHYYFNYHSKSGKKRQFVTFATTYNPVGDQMI